MRVRSQKLIHWSRKHAKKTQFSKKFSYKGQPQIRISWNVSPQIKNSQNGPAQFRNSWIELPQIENSRNEPAQFRNSRNMLPDLSWQFVVAHFRNSWFELAHFGISWIVVAHFRNSWFEAGPFKKLFSKLSFFGMFFTSMNQFLASNSHLCRWHVYSAKKWSKKLIPVWNKGSNILLPHIWSHHRLLCSMTKLKEHSREIC